MLLNLSNHPAQKWTNEQRQTAEVKYGLIQDLPFPNIPPTATTDDIRRLVEQYESTIREMDPIAVHIMGEMTFTFQMVNQLRAIGIPCIASTTNRIVEEKDGKKIVQFEFVQFRAYS